MIQQAGTLNLAPKNALPEPTRRAAGTMERSNILQHPLPFKPLCFAINKQEGPLSASSSNENERKTSRGSSVSAPARSLAVSATSFLSSYHMSFKNIRRSRRQLPLVAAGTKHRLRLPHVDCPVRKKTAKVFILFCCIQNLERRRRALYGDDRGDSVTIRPS